MAVSVSREELEAEGLEVTGDDDLPDVGVTPGFHGDPAERFFMGGDKVNPGAAGRQAYHLILGE